VEYSELNFPDVIKELGVIAYTFDAVPSSNNEYQFVLYEYNKFDKPIRKHVSKGTWRKGQTFAFDLRTDYYLVDGRKYALKTIIYIENNREVYDVVFIDLR